MKNPLLIAFSFLIFSTFSYKNINVNPVVQKPNVVYSTNNNSEALYNELHLSDYGLSKKAFDYAYKGYQRLVKKNKINNSDILSICDMSQSSNKKRFYILDLANNEVLLTSYVAHGKGSGMEYAIRFSNKPNSHQSSLGFYITGSTYYGEHGLSLRLNGLEAGFNDHAARRHIVIHGASYIGNDYLDENKFMGRSYGCPAVPADQSEKIIDLIKNGTCLFIYYPAKTYLQKSKILNG